MQFVDFGMIQDDSENWVGGSCVQEWTRVTVFYWEERLGYACRAVSVRSFSDWCVSSLSSPLFYSSHSCYPPWENQDLCFSSWPCQWKSGKQTSHVITWPCSQKPAGLNRILQFGPKRNRSFPAAGISSVLNLMMSLSMWNHPERETF